MKEKVVKRSGEPDLVNVADDDARMNWAIEKAQLTLWHREQTIKNPHPEELYLSVKTENGWRVASLID
jgi:hypothetical protein